MRTSTIFAFAAVLAVAATAQQFVDVVPPPALYSFGNASNTTAAPNATTMAPNTTIAPNVTTIAPNATTVAPNTTVAPDNTTAPVNTTEAPTTTAAGNHTAAPHDSGHKLTATDIAIAVLAPLGLFVLLGAFLLVTRPKATAPTNLDEETPLQPRGGQ